MTAAAPPADTGAHRYRLDRAWDPALPRMLWVMLNPSTADAYADDPTVGRCAGFARRRRWGFGSLTIPHG